MNAPGFRNPEAKVEKLFLAAFKKVQAIKSLAAFGQEIDAQLLSDTRVVRARPELAALRRDLQALRRRLAIVSATELEKKVILEAVEQHVGLKAGEVCCVPGKRPFVLTGAWLEGGVDSSGPLTLRISGPIVGESSRQAPTEQFSCTSADELLALLGRPPMDAPAYACKDPSQMSAEELLAELETYCHQEISVPYYVRDGVSTVAADIVWLLDRVIGQSVFDGLGYSEREDIAVGLDVNSHDNLWITTVRATAPPANMRWVPSWELDWELRRMKLGELTIRNFQSLMDQHDYDPGRSEAALNAVRMHSLLVYAAERAVNGCIDLFRAKYNVWWTGGRIVVRQVSGKLPYLSIAYRRTNINSHRSHPAVALTDLTSDSLLECFDRLQWRDVRVEEALRWAAQVVSAGGRNVTSDANWLATALDFYRANDPETLAKERAEADEQRAAYLQHQKEKSEERRSAIESQVRDVLKTASIGHGTGWRQAVAKAAGIPEQKVKLWLKQRLPDEYMRIYPNDSPRAVGRQEKRR